jgi:large subunit ribosomal protein L16
MLSPKKVKYKKIHKPKIMCQHMERKLYFNFMGTYALKALESGRIRSLQIEALRKVIVKYLKKYGKIFIMIFPDKSITKKPENLRMGKGKGNHKEWISLVKKGRIILEVFGIGIPINLLVKVLKIGSQKLAIKTKLILKKI